MIQCNLAHDLRAGMHPSEGTALKQQTLLPQVQGKGLPPISISEVPD